MNKRKLFPFVLVFLLVFPAFAGSVTDIRRDVYPLTRNGIALHLESYVSDSSLDAASDTTSDAASNAGNEPLSGSEPLLLIHGLTYSSHEFDVNCKDYSLARFFAHNGFKVWLLDIAGYGSSQEVEDGFMPDSDYAAEDIAAAVRFILDKSGRKSLDILGWSWGTVTSGRFAAKNPDLVKRLVLYAPIVAGLADVKVEVPFNHNTWLHAAGDFQVKADGSIDYEIVEPEVVDTFLSNCWRFDKDSSPNGGRKDLLVSPEKRLIPTAQLNIPVLIIAGANDPYVSPELCREAFNSLPDKNSRLEIIEGAAHAMMMEKPYYKIFRNKVLDFLKAN